MSNPRKNFNKLYDKYIGKIYRFIFFKVNSQEVAEDLCSEVFTKTWQAIKNGTKLDNISGYLYQIARNLVIDYYRQKPAPQVSLADCEEVPDPKIDIKEAVSVESDVDRVKASLANVKNDYREILTLRYIEDYSIPEIARILDRPEGTIRVMIHRGIEELRATMGGTESL